MRVCIDIQSIITSPSGVGRYTKELVKALSELQVKEDITLFYFNFLGRYKGLPVFPNKTIRCIPGRVYNKLWKWFHFPPLNWFIGKFDIYHFPNFNLPPMNHGKFIITVHDLAFMRYPEYIEPKNLKFLEAHLPPSLQKAHRIITVSQFCKQELINIFNLPPEKISVVYEGVSDNFKKAVIPSLELPSKYILCVSTLEPRKNIEGLIRAFHISELKDYKLVIAGGKGWLYEGIFKSVKELGLEKDVIFLGYIPEEDLPGIYSMAKLFVFPSFYEGFGFPPLEAMACGVPVVSSRVNEVLGDSAYFIDPNKPEDIARGIKEVLENEELQKELIGKGGEHVKKFSWRKAAEETMNLYKKLNDKLGHWGSIFRQDLQD